MFASSQSERRQSRVRLILIEMAAPLFCAQNRPNICSLVCWRGRDLRYSYLNTPTDREVLEFILHQYEVLYEEYIADRAKIPEGSLCEVRFDDLVRLSLSLSLSLSHTHSLSHTFSLSLSFTHTFSLTLSLCLADCVCVVFHPFFHPAVLPSTCVCLLTSASASSYHYYFTVSLYHCVPGSVPTTNYTIAMTSHDVPWYASLLGIGHGWHYKEHLHQAWVGGKPV